MTIEEFNNRRRASAVMSQGMAAFFPRVGRSGITGPTKRFSVSTRTFRRWRARHEDVGEVGLYEHRLDRISSNKVPAHETMKVLQLFETRYFDYSVRHSHDTLVADHGK